jgi:drug/metabolite transporter (DMT)-like permease
VLTRLCARTDGPVAQLFHNALFATLILALMLPWVWTPMTVRDGAMLLFGGVLVTFGHFLLVKAFTLALSVLRPPPVSTQIVTLLPFGSVVRCHVPTLSTLAGAVVIIGCGVALIRSRA